MVDLHSLWAQVFKWQLVVVPIGLIKSTHKIPKPNVKFFSSFYHSQRDNLIQLLLFLHIYFSPLVTFPDYLTCVTLPHQRQILWLFLFHIQEIQQCSSQITHTLPLM